MWLFYELCLEIIFRLCKILRTSSNEIYYIHSVFLIVSDRASHLQPMHSSWSAVWITVSKWRRLSSGTVNTFVALITTHHAIFECSCDAPFPTTLFSCSCNYFNSLTDLFWLIAALISSLAFGVTPSSILIQWKWNKWAAGLWSATFSLLTDDLTTFVGVFRPLTLSLTQVFTAHAL